MKTLWLLPVLIALPASAHAAPASEAAFFGQLRNFEGGFIRQMQKEVFSAHQPLPTHEEAYRQAVAALKGSGVPESFVKAAFADPKVKVDPAVLERFSTPSESMFSEGSSYEDYRKIFITPERIEEGQAFYLEQKKLLGDVRSRTGLDPLVLVSLVGVETRFGRRAGRFTVFNALYTITRGVPSRSKWGGQELAEYLKLCYWEKAGTQSILGSYAGAFGYFQFMPSSYNASAVDFDGDGKRHWDQWPDVFGSIANYLNKAGYKAGPEEGPGSPVWRALYAYNHSDNYVKVILELKGEISKGLPKK